MAAAMVLAATFAQPVQAQTAGSLPPVMDETPVAPAAVAPASDNRLLVLGLGALGGVVAFNLATGGLSALPFIGGTGAAVSSTEGAIAVSRVYAVSSSLAGALAADWLTSPETTEPVRSGRIPTAVAYRVMP